ncbi:kinesin-domain-containing protein [Aspergillus crustosus]
MNTRSKPSTRRTGQKEAQPGSVDLSQRDMQRPGRTSQPRKTAHAKDPCVSTNPKSRDPECDEEDHAVILRTDGIKGKIAEVSMGTLSHKTYKFDRVFSSAADQRTVYEDTVLPMVDEVLSGYNCTVFAYGQTGTGKTYTMFGKMEEELGLLSDNAGIIPRTLYTLFDKVKGSDSIFKCSFIVLYNEAVRDLLSDEEDTKLQLFENERNGANGILLVKGMQESCIDSPSAGIKLLQMGSRKRQVAATKCNDLSSRTHTILTINVLTRTSKESITSGKLNLVDLAGSENIQQSGAENKRAISAGQINKSLLMLGRAINAPVDKSLHVPYRLLQDSLGGRTKTCIIATVSPCQLSQEETVSTLDYAFRSKNIHNRPQISTPVPKDMIKEIESRRIINKEQKQRIETLESGLQRKAEELLAARRQLRDLDFDNKAAHLQLGQLNDTLNKAQTMWDGSVAEVSDITEKVGTRVNHFQAHQTRLLREFSTKLSRFLENEMMAAQKNQTILYDTLRTQPLKDKVDEAFHTLKQISTRVRMIVSGASNELSHAITRISEGLEGEQLECNNQFDIAYSTLDKDIQSTFQTIVKHVGEQNVGISELRHRLQDASSRMLEMNHKTSLDVAQHLEEERTSAEVERNKFLTQISAIYDLSFQQRWDRLQGKYGIICNDISSSRDLMEGITMHSRINECITRQKQLAEELVDSRNHLKVRMGQDTESLGEQHLSARQAAVSAKKDLQQSLENHEGNLNEQLELWAQVLEKTQSQNNQLRDAYLGHLDTLETTIKQAYSTVKDQLGTVLESSSQIQRDMALHSDMMEQPIATLKKEICVPLLHLRTSMRSRVLPTTSASLKQVSNHANASPQHDGKDSLTSFVHKGPKEQDFCDRPGATHSNQEGSSHGKPDNLVGQPCFMSDDCEQPQPKRRRL